MMGRDTQTEEGACTNGPEVVCAGSEGYRSRVGLWAGQVLEGGIQEEFSCNEVEGES